MLLDIMKYFGFELGAQAQMGEKLDGFVIKGAHDREKLQNLLDGFIKRFVLCSHCGNPETELVRIVLVIRID
jgi:translation initiation factor 5